MFDKNLQMQVSFGVNVKFMQILKAEYFIQLTEKNDTDFNRSVVSGRPEGQKNGPDSNKVTVSGNYVFFTLNKQSIPRTVNSTLL